MNRRRRAHSTLLAFSSGLLQRYPAFVAEPSQAPWVQLWRWRTHGRANVFVAFQYHDTDDAFTVEVAWALTSGKMPAQADQFAVEPLTQPPAVRGGLSFRLGEFLDKPRDYWWDLSTGSEHRHRNAIEASIDGLEPCLTHAFALLEKGLAYVLARAGAPAGV